MKLYLIGSLRNPKIPELGKKIRALGYDVFDDWHGAGKIADESWQEYEQIRGRTYQQALDGYAAWQIFNFDKKHLDASDLGVLVHPAGKSGHLEFGYLIGRGKPGYILFDQEPERWDVMARFATHVCFSEEELCKYLSRSISISSSKRTVWSFLTSRLRGYAGTTTVYSSSLSNRTGSAQSVSPSVNPGTTRK
jgi:hypothetical protein